MLLPFEVLANAEAARKDDIIVRILISIDLSKRLPDAETGFLGLRLVVIAG
jgi:hypothetical protein